MGFKSSMLALSPGIPREDVLAVEEGGHAAAALAIETLWPGRWRLADTATLSDARDVCLDCLWVGTWGETVLLVNTDPYELCDDEALRVDGRGLWLLVGHEAVSLAAYRTPERFGARDVAVDAESSAQDLRAALSGDLLDFEEPYARGEHMVGDAPYHPVDLARSALIWCFGISPSVRPSDAVTDSIASAEPSRLRMHRFAPVTSPRRRRLWRAMS